MSNFPSKWLEFSGHKEIKLLRKAVSDTLSFKVELTVAIVIAIIDIFFGQDLQCWPQCLKLVSCALVCIAIIGFFLKGEIGKKLKSLFIDNVVLQRKQAVDMFDDEIVYDIMIAVEFYENIEKLEGTLACDTKEFYVHEMSYYITRAKHKLVLLNSNFRGIIGDSDTKISLNRIKNVLNIIEKIEVNCPPIDHTLKEQYEILVDNINNYKPSYPRKRRKHAR